MINQVKYLRAMVFVGFVVLASASASMPELEFVDRESGNLVTLEQFAGEIVVLDYFAYWCAPCAPASRKIEEGIARHYRTGGGAGVPVRVLGVNTSTAQPAKTEQFIAKAQMGHVVNDPDGRSHTAWGARSLPYIVVLDGRQVVAGNGFKGWKVAYQHNGLESVAKLRQVIDRLRKGAGS